jgi:hypothetical protein
MRVDPPTRTTYGLNQLLKLLAGNFALIAPAVGEFDIELGGRLRGERNLAFYHSFANLCHDLRVTSDIHPHIALNVVEGDGDEQVVDIVSAEVGVAVGGDHLEDSVMQFQD